MEDPSLAAGWLDAYQNVDAETDFWNDEPIPVLQPVLDQLLQRGSHTVLDLGCGTGRNIIPLVENGMMVTGIDISTDALKIAQMRSGGRCFVTCTDIRDLAVYVDQSVDAINCFDVLGQVDDPAVVLAAAHRVVRTGGIFSFNLFSLEDSQYGLGEEIGKHRFDYKSTLFRFFDRDEVEDLVTSDGWHTVSFTEIRWDDPPHGDFRPYPHEHANWCVTLERT